MNESEFWSIIERSRRGTGSDPDKHEANLRRELEALTPDQIVQFDLQFGDCVRKGYRWDLWGAAYIIGGGCSDDGFWDFRQWLVARGESIYKAALENPESLVEVIDQDDPNRKSLNVSNPAMFVWGEKLGKDELGLDEYPGIPGSNLGEEPAGEEWKDDVEELAKRYPKLWAKYGW